MTLYNLNCQLCFFVIIAVMEHGGDADSFCGCGSVFLCFKQTKLFLLQLCSMEGMVMRCVVVAVAVAVFLIFVVVVVLLSVV